MIKVGDKVAVIDTGDYWLFDNQRRGVVVELVFSGKGVKVALENYDTDYNVLLFWQHELTKIGGERR